MNELRHDCEIISHIGVIGSGKDFHAMELINNYGYEHINFADPIREILWILLKFKPKDIVEYDKLKASIFENSELGISLTGRDLLLRIGNDVGREYFGKTFWTDFALKRIRNLIDIGKTKVANSDTRYFDECRCFINFCKENGFRYKFLFTNYNSPRYNKNLFSESEFLARIFLEMNKFHHLDDVTSEVERLAFADHRLPFTMIKIGNQTEVFLTDEDRIDFVVKNKLKQYEMIKLDSENIAEKIMVDENELT
jgi:hypothetical protein